MGRKRLTQEQFIEKAKKIYGNRYDFSITNYITYDSNIDVICPIHGKFTICTNNFLQGQGCPKCKHRRLTTDDFIKEAKAIHGDFYDYSKTIYTKMKSDITITCPIHGDFYQPAYKHLLGHGCQKCGIIKRSKTRTLSTEQFIEKARKIHGEKYDYSKSIYLGTYDNITITCPIHGDFEQIANDHLNGHGCQKCKQSQLESEIERFLKENNIKYIHLYRNLWLGLQSLDFYLPDYNSAIECQGTQHFEPVDFFGGKETYEKTVERDKIKLNKCIKNGVKLFYYANYQFDFPYKVFTDKEELLSEIKKVEN